MTEVTTYFCSFKCQKCYETISHDRFTWSVLCYLLASVTPFKILSILFLTLSCSKNLFLTYTEFRHVNGMYQRILELLDGMWGDFGPQR